MNKKRVAFHTLGCKLNFSETSGFAREIMEDCQVVDFTEISDFYVIQSCAVTATAEKKCRAVIRQANKRNPEASIFVIGCMSQLRAEQLAAMEGVSMVLGNSEKYDLRTLINNNSHDVEDKIKVSNILKTKAFHPSYSGSERTRTFIKIQDGCDYFCSFCTIPFARGLSRSNSIAKTIELIKTALKDLPAEIVLTGVNIGDFGKPNDESLIQLMHEIENLRCSVRFRLSSIEPDLLTDDIINHVATSEIFMPHFHIPLQSGSDSVLKRMNRRYKADNFESRVSLINESMPYACIAADVITGFPGETEEEFEETYNLIHSLPVSYLHVFPYSERPKTKASQMQEKLDASIIQQRVGKLIRLSEVKKKKFLDNNIGRVENVLFESENANGYISGFTTNNIRVKTRYRKEFVNCVIKTHLISIDNDGVFIFKPVD